MLWIDNPLTNKSHLVKKVNVWDYRKHLQNIKKAKLFLWEEGSLGVRPNRRKGFQLHLTENVLEDILPS